MCALLNILHAGLFCEYFHCEQRDTFYFRIYFVKKNNEMFLKIGLVDQMDNNSVNAWLRLD